MPGEGPERIEQTVTMRAYNVRLTGVLWATNVELVLPMLRDFLRARALGSTKLDDIWASLDFKVEEIGGVKSREVGSGA